MSHVDKTMPTVWERPIVLPEHEVRATLVSRDIRCI